MAIYIDGQVVDVSEGQHESVSGRQLAQELGDTTRERAIEIVEVFVRGASAHPTRAIRRCSLSERR